MTQPKISDEAITAAAEWWAKVLENPTFDALGKERDANMEMAQMLMRMGALKNPPDPEALALFRETLAVEISSEREAALARAKTASAESIAALQAQAVIDHVIASLRAERDSLEERVAALQQKTDEGKAENNQKQEPKPEGER